MSASISVCLEVIFERLVAAPNLYPSFLICAKFRKYLEKVWLNGSWIVEIFYERSLIFLASFFRTSKLFVILQKWYPDKLFYHRTLWNGIF